MPWTAAAPTSVFLSQQDPMDPRLSEWAKSQPIVDLQSFHALPTDLFLNAWALLGYADDEGIALNGGRVGAREAPNEIRSVFYKMTPSLLNPARKNLLDLGNVAVDVPLAERHQRGRAIVHAVLKRGAKTLSLGGGHDYGYADGAGFLDHCLALNLRPVVINFDAHLDVRPSDKGFHSGTPFHRLLSDYAGKFDFVEVGLQNQCNSFEHLKWARQQGAQTLLLEDIRSVGLLSLLQPLLETFAGRPCFVSVDIDSFSSSEAPGCSQSWPSGLTFAEFSPVLHEIQRSLQVLGLGIYEVAPSLDVGRMTSKLAALILHQTLFNA